MPGLTAFPFCSSRSHAQLVIEGPMEDERSEPSGDDQRRQARAAFGGMLVRVWRFRADFNLRFRIDHPARKTSLMSPRRSARTAPETVVPSTPLSAISVA